MTRVVKTILIALVLLACPRTAAALCYASPWPFGLCAEYWSYDAVFEGSVISIEQKDADPNAAESVRLPYRIITFHVHRRWRGQPDGTVRLRTYGSPTMAVGEDFRFTTGKRYVVFATRASDGWLTTNACTPTTEIGSPSAEGTLDFLASLSRPSPGARVFGTLTDGQPPGAAGRAPASVIVTLEGEGIRKQITSTDGTYNFSRLKAGRYTLTATSRRAGAKPLTVRIDVPDSHACVEASVDLR